MKINLNFNKYLMLINLIVSSLVANGQQDSSRITYNPLSDFDYRLPLFKLEDSQLTNDNRMLRYSALIGYREGVEPIKGFANFSNYLDRKNGTFKIYMLNLSIQDMLTHGFYKSNRVILEVKHPEKYRYVYSNSKETNLEWLKLNGYCFELMMPIGSMTNGIKILDEELGYIFGVKFYKQKRLVNSLVLVRTSNHDKIKTKKVGVGNYDFKGHFNNVPIRVLGNVLNNFELPPFVDETGYKGNVDMDLIMHSWKDISTLRKELQKYDLDIKEVKREIEMFVIHEIDY